MHIDGGDTAWVLGSAALVLFMTPGLALFYGGGWHLMRLQATAVGAAVGYSFVATLILAKVIDLVMGLRLTKDQELEGMDTVLHAETAYDFGGVSAGGFSPGQRAAHQTVSLTEGASA